MLSRRTFLGGLLGGTGMAMGIGSLRDDSLDRITRAGMPGGESDEDFWRTVQQAFSVNRNILNLNNGGVCPSPRVVEEAVRRALDLSNQAPAYTLGRVLGPELEVVRKRLAREFGCDPEELAITRNASESLETLILGLNLKPGDEVLVTSHNYPRMVQTWKQRAAREGIKLIEIEDVPVRPADPLELVEIFRRRITPRTRVIEVVHVANRNGQIYPVREICRLGRERNIEVIVDGAHAFAHFPFTRDELECDFYGTSLHKWLTAPIGTGFLYVRKERIKDVWPLMAAAESQHNDIRKFEEIGTHPMAQRNAISEAMDFHQAIGGERKADRLRFLSRRWIGAVASHSRVRILTNDQPNQSCGLRMLALEGIPPGQLARYLWDRHRIVVSPITMPGLAGVRVTPNVYTTLEELERFAEVILDVAERGIPG